MAVPACREDGVSDVTNQLIRDIDIPVNAMRLNPKSLKHYQRIQISTINLNDYPDKGYKKTDKFDHLE